MPSRHIALALTLALSSCNTTPPPSEGSEAGPVEAQAPGVSEELEQGPVLRPLYGKPRMESLSKGASSAIQAPRICVVEDVEHLARVWADHTANIVPRPAQPEVDFEQWRVLAVFLGSRNTGGHGVEIVSCSGGSGCLVVVVLEQRPEPGSIQTMALTSPFHLALISREPGGVDVRWQKP